jgi:hypothetical protein
MAINRIYARSPFIIEVDEVGQSGSKVELYIYTNGSPVPATPTYTLEKLIPASNNTQTLYNISPYLMEYITHDIVANNYSSDNDTLATNQYICVDVKRYKLVSNVYTLLNTITYFAFDGFGYYSQGYNPIHIPQAHAQLDEQNYYYWADANNNPSANPLQRGGTITTYLPTGYYVKYIQLQTGLTYTSAVSPLGNIYEVYRIYPSYYLTGNKVEIYTNTNILIWEATFYPIEECYYDVVTCDFINMYGAWQREFFFKASYESLSTSTTEFNLMQEMGLFGSWDTQRNQRQTFNTNGIISYRVNTGWVDETFNSNLQQLLLSERILLNGLPVKMKSKELEKQKNINNKKINYVLQFDQSNDLINNVI